MLMNNKETSLQRQILSQMQLLWQQDTYTRELATQEINRIVDENGLTEETIKVKVLSLGGDQGFTIDVKILDKEKVDE